MPRTAGTKRANGLGSVFMRKRDGRWGCAITMDFPDGSRRPVTTWHDTEKEAHQALARRLTEAARGEAVAPDQQTVAEFLNQWLEEVVRPNRKHRTYVSYEAEVRLRIRPHLGHLRLQRLTAQQIQRWLTGLRKETYRRGPDGPARPHSPRQAQLAYAVLHIALAQAVDWDILARNPADRVERPAYAAKPVSPYSVAQARTLLAQVAGDRLEHLYRVALGMGLRLGELIGLRWEDVALDSDPPTLAVSQQIYRQWEMGGEGSRLVAEAPKSLTGRRRLVLPARLVEALRDQSERLVIDRRLAGERWQEHGLVFPSSIGTPLEPTTIRRHFHRSRLAASLPHRRPHDMRHSAASFMLAQGVPMKAVQHILGHATFAVTADTYSHLLDEVARDAAERMDAMFGRLDEPEAPTAGRK